jgi:hypothetical protein
MIKSLSSMEIAWISEDSVCVWSVLMVNKASFAVASS